ncbi:MAG: hypothetical protein ACTSO9_09710 [Candidatus Helarchaeota archaeon]
MSESETEFMIVDELKPSLRGINLKIKCTSKNEEKEVINRKTGETFRVTEALVGDKTGSIYLTLWNDDIDKMEIDHSYKLVNVYTSVFKGSMRLNLGKYGSFEEIEEEETPIEVNTENNLSDREYQQPRKFYPKASGRKYPGQPGGKNPYRRERRKYPGKRRY